MRFFILMVLCSGLFSQEIMDIHMKGGGIKQGLITDNDGRYITVELYWKGRKIGQQKIHQGDIKEITAAEPEPVDLLRASGTVVDEPEQPEQPVKTSAIKKYNAYFDRLDEISKERKELEKESLLIYDEIESIKIDVVWEWGQDQDLNIENYTEQWRPWILKLHDLRAGGEDNKKRFYLNCRRGHKVTAAGLKPLPEGFNW